MTAFIIIVFILLLLIGYLVLSGGKRKKEQEENLKCLSAENYELIRDSPYADELSKYSIGREADKLKFGKEGYTLFYLQLVAGTTRSVELIGLDGYGIRDKEFLKYTCELVRKIGEKNQQLNLP